MPKRRMMGWILGVLLLCGVSARPALAQGDALTLKVGTAEEGWPVVVGLGPLLDDEGLRDALDSALPLRFHLRVELWRRGLFDHLEGSDERNVAIVKDPLDDGYQVEAPRVQRRVDTLAEAQAALDALLRPELRPRDDGRYYYLGVLEVETLSLSDLEELRRWLRGDVGPAIEGNGSAGQAIERGLRRLMIRVIGLPSRRFEARSPSFETE